LYFLTIMEDPDSDEIRNHSFIHHPKYLILRLQKWFSRTQLAMTQQSC